jgi:hypothetical protein
MNFLLAAKVGLVADRCDATSRDQADRWTSLAPIVFANASVAAAISHLPDTGMTAPDDEFVLTPTEPAQSG